MAINIQCLTCNFDYDVDIVEVLESVECLTCPNCNSEPDPSLVEDLVTSISNIIDCLRELGTKFYYNIELDTEELVGEYLESGAMIDSDLESLDGDEDTE